MTWKIDAPQADEASKIRWELVPYFRGVCYDLGCGPFRVFPHFVGVDNGHHWGRGQASILVKTCESLDIFASGTADLVFSSHLLEHIAYENVPATLREWCRIIKDGGHLALYIPDEDEYPKVGEEGANPDHKWNCNYAKLLKAMESVHLGWDLIDFQKRNQENEYSLFFVFRIGGRGHRISYLNPKPAKTCAVIRYGAIGDAIQTSSIFQGLKDQGYHLTLYCQSGQGYEVIKNDPHVDRFIVQDRDNVPPDFQEEFWNYTKKKYDKWVNLCESVEGTLLAIAGRPNHEWPNEVRAKYLNRNYLEFIHEIAQVPPPYRPRFYSTPEERNWASKKASSWGSKNILFSLAGSSGHKVWPHLDAIIAMLMITYKNFHVVLVGDDACRILEQGWQKEPRVHCMSGRWTIRESLAFAEASDLVIGGETGVLNAVGMLDVPKIVTLSHSSAEMLTKHWKNTINLEQPRGVGCPKSPCRQLHHSWEHCMKHESGEASMCQYHISPQMMWQAIESILGAEQKKVA